MCPFQGFIFVSKHEIRKPDPGILFQKKNMFNLSLKSWSTIFYFIDQSNCWTTYLLIYLRQIRMGHGKHGSLITFFSVSQKSKTENRDLKQTKLKDIRPKCLHLRPRNKIDQHVQSQTEQIRRIVWTILKKKARFGREIARKTEKQLKKQKQKTKFGKIERITML